MASPSDPCVPIGDLLGGVPDDDGRGMYSAMGQHRAAVMSFHASELGCDFRDVSCHTRCIRVLTRQESWDAGGQDWWAGEQQMRYGIGYYFGHSDAARQHGAGWYFDAVILPDGTNEPAPAGLVRFTQIDEQPKEPPYGWAPGGGAYSNELYEIVDRDHPEARPVYFCQT